MATSPTPPTVPPQRTFLGHPLGLYVLFFTEMWERFSYYGMRALLILYLVNYFRMDTGEAATIYKWYTSLVYLTPLIGGFLADRYLGNRIAVIIGATLMAIGHFLMAFEDIGIIYSALGFLIIGNGFFKPNMSVQVGRLYPTNDKRRDGAYTIFYMGINLGAFIAPLLCGWLALNTVGGYHSGFTVAGIGMVLGLLIYLAGQPIIKEVDESAEAAPEHREEPPENAKEDTAIPEEVAERTKSEVPFLSQIAPGFLVGLGCIFLALAPISYLTGFFDLPNAMLLVLTGGTAFFAAWVASKVRNAVRDRVLAIYAIGLLPIFFWGAFEQTGNALNLWADKVTDRHITQPMPDPDKYPEVVEPALDEDGEATRPEGLDRWTTMFKLKPTPEGEEVESGVLAWFRRNFNPVPTEWFQSINALAIFLLAPVFAFLWIKVSIPIPIKMIMGVAFMSSAMLVMVFGAMSEAVPSETAFSGPLPEGVTTVSGGKLAVIEDGETEVVHTGRLIYDEDNGRFLLEGVLPDIQRDKIVRATAPADFREAIEQLVKDSERATADSPVTKTFEQMPEDFDWRYAGMPKADATFDPDTNTITVYTELQEKELKGIMLAGGDPEFRDAIDRLYVQSGKFRVVPWWLVAHFILATIGELCLSPVGLSAVSKLAPRNYATMLMGMWLLTSFFGGFMAGTMGELYSTVPPVTFFWISVGVTAGVSLLALLFARKVIRMMHGVN